MKDSSERQYNEDWLQVRPQPMFDDAFDVFYTNFYQSDSVPTNEELVKHFKYNFEHWFIINRKFSTFYGLVDFPYTDIIYGCTQYIDDIYQRVGPKGVQVLEGEYAYHKRLNPDLQYSKIGELDPNKELIISLPFPKYADVHPWMSFILDECYIKNIPVHVDGAWIGSCRDIEFNFDHPAIKTVGVSLSKAGMGANRVGVRYARSRPEGAVTIMNDFSMVQQALLEIGIRFMQKFEPDYLWEKYSHKYDKVCKDFNLIPTKCIHVAMKEIDGQLHPRGVRPLLRCL